MIAKVALTGGYVMNAKITNPKSRWFKTTIGEFVEAVYEAAMEEYMNEAIARRIAMQMLLRKLRLQHKIFDGSITKKAAPQKKAYLRSELDKKRAKKA